MRKLALVRVSYWYDTVVSYHLYMKGHFMFMLIRQLPKYTLLFEFMQNNQQYSVVCLHSPVKSQILKHLSRLKLILLVH